MVNVLGALASGALSLGTAGVNYMLAEKHADNAMSRQQELLSKQYALNQAAQVNALPNQVQGARLAGLNPAGFNGQMSSAQSVGLGSAPKAENVEVSPQDVLMMAQAKNLDADTDKKRAEIGNVNEDTELKFAQKLFTGADQTKVEHETQTIRNTNDAFASENRAIGKFGQAMAERWMNSDWFDKLSPDTRDSIQSIADGTTPLTVGSMRALTNAVNAQKNLSDADASTVRNAFSNAVIESQFNTDDVFDAIVRDPKVRQDLTTAQTDKLRAEIDRISYRYKEVIDEELKKISAETNETKAKAALERAEKRIRDLDFKKLKLDPIIRRYEGDILGYFGSMAERVLDAGISSAPTIAASHLAGRVAGKAAGNATSTAVDKAAEYGRTYKAEDWN